MAADPNERVDQALRGAYAVDDMAATRVASRALAAARSERGAPGARRRTRRLPASLAVATIALCAVLAVWISRTPTVRPLAGPEVGALTELSGSLIDGVLILRIGDGVVVASSDQRDRPRDGSGIVIVEGDVR